MWGLLEEPSISIDIDNELVEDKAHKIKGGYSITMHTCKQAIKPTKHIFRFQTPLYYNPTHLTNMYYNSSTCEQPRHDVLTPKD